MKLKFFLVYLIFYSNSSLTYCQDMRLEILTRQAKIMVESVLIEDHTTTLKYTYPLLVEKMGGIEKGIIVLEKMADDFRNRGIKIIKAEIGDPKNIYEAGEQLHCLVPQRIVMQVEGGTLVTNAYLLGVSEDEGKNWFFMDASMINNNNATQAFPNFNTNLVLPEKQKPTFFPETENR